MTDIWDMAGYVAGSRYRREVCEFLETDGPEQPSTIAAAVDLAQPHVSRSLSELRERGVVELLVPESQQKGRLYDLTPEGREALARLRGETEGRDEIRVEFVDVEQFPHRELLQFLVDEYGESLRLVVAREGDETEVYVADDSVPDHDEEVVAQMVAALRPGGEADPSDPATLPTGETRYVVRGFDETTLVRLPLSAEREVLLALGREADLAVDSFVSACQDRIVAEP
jgi:DNA-binding MarR family transcriptional regulator